jgi:DNA repair protein RecO
MHHIYHTEGIILGSKNYGETGKYYSIFTRDLGMIYASAQGVRKIASKLRFILQDFSYIKVDLVQGKDFWRVTSASKTNMLGGLTKNPGTFGVVFNVAKLLKRLLAGVEPNQALFSDLINGLAVLEKIGTKELALTQGGDLRNIEVIIVLRILNNLGYIGDNEVLQNLIKSPFEENLIFEVSKSRPQVLNQINKALKETHL